MQQQLFGLSLRTMEHILGKEYSPEEVAEMKRIALGDNEPRETSLIVSSISRERMLP
jgi:hypothetical protein